jgi:8-oxo-dGTP pyrophosphatase MutT (NUDIX family)
MQPGKVRPLAICVFRRDARVFVAEGYDPAKDEVFYRPLGGAIQFGEHSRQTVERELREEIGAEVGDLRYLGTLENLFTYDGERGHEIVVVYEGSFVNEAFYEQACVEGREDDGTPFKAVWMPLDVFRRGEAPLYPDGLLAWLSDDEPS